MELFAKSLPATMVFVVPFYGKYNALFLDLASHGKIDKFPIILETRMIKPGIESVELVKDYFKTKFGFMPNKIIYPSITATFKPLLDLTMLLIPCVVDELERTKLGTRFKEIAYSNMLMMRDTNIFFDLSIRILGTNADRLDIILDI